MNKVSKSVGVVVVFLLAGIVGYASWSLFVRGNLGAANAPLNSSFNTTTDSYLNYGTQDVVGTHIGTSTVGASFPTPNVTSSFISVIGRNVKQADYQIFITAVTNTNNNLSFTVQGSNDYLCGTLAGSASSTTDVVQANINWYDAMSHLKGRVHPTSLGNGSSTVVYDWNDATVGSAQKIILEDLDFECLKFLMSVSSTKPYVGLNTK